MLESNERPASLKKLPSDALHLFTDRTNTMAYCDIPKSASSTFRHTFCMSQKRCRRLFIQNNLTPFTNIEELNQVNKLNIVKFMFVRHPFERLASAYNDKFVKNKNIPLFIPFDQRESKNKNIPYESKVDGTKVTVQEAYISYIRSYQKRYMNITSTDTCLDDSSLNFKFYCFVEYVLDSTRDEEKMADVFGQRKDCHWWPYTEMCRVCKIRYDFVGHIEDFQDDVQLLLAKFPDNKDLLELYKRKTKMNCTSNCEKTKNDVYLKYFSQLRKTTILRLYQRYKHDFELGGYDFPDKYIAAGMADT